MGLGPAHKKTAKENDTKAHTLTPSRLPPTEDRVWNLSRSRAIDSEAITASVSWCQENPTSWVYWARELPKQDLRFPTGWEEIREGQKTLTLLLSLLPDLSTKQTPAFLLSPVCLPKPSERMVLPTGEPQLNRGPNSYTCAPASAVPSAVPCTAGLPEISEERPPAGEAAECPDSILRRETRDRLSPHLSPR